LPPRWARRGASSARSASNARAATESAAASAAHRFGSGAADQATLGGAAALAADLLLRFAAALEPRTAADEATAPFAAAAWASSWAAA
jgi:hypothetical protein